MTETNAIRGWPCGCWGIGMDVISNLEYPDYPLKGVVVHLDHCDRHEETEM